MGARGDTGATGAAGMDGADGQIQTITAGDRISVDATDPANPEVTADEQITTEQLATVTSVSGLTENRIPAASATGLKDTGTRLTGANLENLFVPGQLQTEAGTIRLGNILDIEESGGLVSTTNRLLGTRSNLVDYLTPTDGASGKARRFSISAGEVRSDVETTTTSSLTDTEITATYTAANTARINSLILTASAAITNLRIRVRAEDTGGTMQDVKFLPSRLAWEDATGGIDQGAAGEFTISLTESPVTFDTGTDFEITFRLGAGGLSGSASRPALSAMIQTGSFTEIPDSSDIPDQLTDLSDTPAALGTDGQVLAVNSAGDGTEFIDVPSGITDTERTKLNGIEENAEVNVQADWTETDNTEDSYIQNKPTTISDAERTKLTGIDEGAEVNVQADWDETNTADDSYIQNKPTTISDEERTKLGGIDEGAEVNVQADWTQADPTNDGFILNKPAIITQTERNKLTGIEAGAEVNVQADWDETTSGDDAFILNKPTIPDQLTDLTDTPSAITANQFLRGNSGGTALEFAEVAPGSGATTWTGLTDTPGAITANQFVRGNAGGNGLEFVDAPTGGGLTPDDRTKLDGIDAGAEVNVQADWTETDTTDDSYIQNKPTIPANIPDQFTDLTDTPSDLTADQFVRVNSAGDALIYSAGTTVTVGNITVEDDGAEEVRNVSIIDFNRNIDVVDQGSGRVEINTEQNFLRLTDSPAAYIAERFIRVNEAGDALEFVERAALTESDALNVRVAPARLTGLLAAVGNVQTALERIDATGLGADITRFAGGYTATSTNAREWVNRHVQGQDGQGNARRTLNLPTTATLTTQFDALEALGLPELIRMTISYLGGPSTSFFSNSLGVRRPSGTSPTFGFTGAINLIREESVTLEVEREMGTIGQWQRVASGRLQNAGDDNLDDIELRNQGWNAGQNTFLPNADQVLKGYAFEVFGAAEGGSTRFDQILYNGDWVVWSADTFTSWVDTDNWFVIAAGDVYRITAQQSRFLTQVVETDTPAPTGAIGNARIWFLETRPTQAPLLRDGQTGSFTTDTQLNNRIVLIAVPNTFGINDLTFQDANPDGSVTTFAVADQFVDYASVIPDNSNGSYYLMGAAVDSARLYRLFRGHTVTIRQSVTNRHYTINSEFVDFTQNINNLPITRLAPSVQAMITAGTPLSTQELAKLAGLDTRLQTDNDIERVNLRVKIGQPSITASDYQTIPNFDGILPNFQPETISFLVPQNVDVTNLRRAEANQVTNPVTAHGPLTIGTTVYNAYSSTLPASTNPLNDAWEAVGTRSNFELSGAENTFKIHRGNLDDVLAGAIFNTPVNPDNLPEVVEHLSNDLTFTTTTTTAWRSTGRQPISSTITLLAAGLWYENRRSFGTANLLDSNIVTGALNFNIMQRLNNYFYYADPTSPLNTGFPGAQSYIENAVARFRNLSGTTPISASRSKIIYFEYALQRELTTTEELNLLRIGQTASEPILRLTREEGLHVRIGRQDGGTRTRTITEPLQSTPRQWSTTNFQPTSGESEIIIPQSLTGAQTITVAIELDNNGNDEGTHTETIALTNVANDQAIGNRTFSYTVNSVAVSITVAVRYESANTDLTDARRVLFLNPSAAFSNNALTYNINASYVRTDSWTAPTTYADFPVNAGSGHDDYGLFDPTRYNTEQVMERNRVLIMFQPSTVGDTSADPEMAVKIIVDGQAEGSDNTQHVINMHRPGTEFDFTDIRMGNNATAVTRVLIADYDSANIPSIQDLQTLYSLSDQWFGVARQPGDTVARFNLDADLELTTGHRFILTDTVTNARQALTVASGTVTTGAA